MLGRKVFHVAGYDVLPGTDDLDLDYPLPLCGARPVESEAWRADFLVGVTICGNCRRIAHLDTEVTP